MNDNVCARVPIKMPIADDGDSIDFCSTCSFSVVCLASGYGKKKLRELHVLVEHSGEYSEGQHIFREGQPFNTIAAVRAGTVKTYITDLEGRELVQGFFLPGEVIGLNAISREKYPCSAVALDRVELCRFAFPQMALLAARMPELLQQLFRLLSEDIGKASLLAGDFAADERMAAFLSLLARRREARGFPPNRFLLSMSRVDIGSYLRLAPETVSRVLRRFRTAKLIRIRRREVELLDRKGLEALARTVLHE